MTSMMKRKIRYGGSIAALTVWLLCTLGATSLAFAHNRDTVKIGKVEKRVAKNESLHEYAWPAFERRLDGIETKQSEQTKSINNLLRMMYLATGGLAALQIALKFNPNFLKGKS